MRDGSLITLPLLLALAALIGCAGALESIIPESVKRPTQVRPAGGVGWPREVQRVAMLPLRDRRPPEAVRDYPWPDADFRARLAAGLVADHNVVLVERDEVERVVRELRLSLADLADPKTAPRLGRLLTADAVLMGEVLDYGKIMTPVAKLVVVLRLVSLETGRVAFTLLVDARKVNTAYPFEVHREVIEETAEKALAAIRRAEAPAPSPSR